MIFGMLIGPTIGKLSPTARSELIIKLFPGFLRYVSVFALMTVIFGLALVLDIGNGNMSVFSLSTSFGLYISIGATLALITMVLAFAVVVPSARKVLRLTQEMVNNSTPPTPELHKVSSRMRIGSAVALVLLILVLVFMVAGVNA